MKEINVFGDWQHAKDRSSQRLSKNGKHPDHVPSREAVFVSLAKGMKNRESQDSS